MEEKYYIQVHIESMGTDYKASGENNITKSIAGHMWYQLHIEDSIGNTINKPIDSGYTARGIVKDDSTSYLGSPAFSSKRKEITKEQFEILKDFGDKENPQLSEQHGFKKGSVLKDGNYEPFTNSCVDFTFKALEIANIHKSSFDGDSIPMNNKDEIIELFKNGRIENYEQKLKDWQEMTPEQKAQAIKNGYGLGLSSTDGIKQFEDTLNTYINDFESNKEEKLENINNLFTQINSLDTTQDKLTLLSSTDLSSSFENNYCKQFISQYQDKVISNEGNSLSSTEIFSIQINPNFNLDSFNSQEEYKPSFAQSFEANNSNSSIQVMG